MSSRVNKRSLEETKSRKAESQKELLDPKTRPDRSRGRDADRSMSRNSARSSGGNDSPRDSSLDRNSSKPGTIQNPDTRRSTRSQKSRSPTDRREESKRSGFRSKSRQARGGLNEPQSPGFGKEVFSDDGRLETFGKRESSRQKEQDGRYGVKSEYDQKRGDNLNTDKRRPPSTQNVDRRKGPISRGGRPPVDKKVDRPDGSAGRRDDNRGGSRGLSRGSERGRSEIGSRAGRGPPSVADTNFDKHIDRRLSKIAYKEPNFIENKKKREKEWLLDFKSHYPVPSKLNKNDETAKDTTGYVIVINEVNSIPITSIPALKEKDTKALVNYSVTLYDQKEREFFGRSYSSRPIQLNPTYTQTINKESIYMHTASQSKDIC